MSINFFQRPSQVGFLALKLMPQAPFITRPKDIKCIANKFNTFFVSIDENLANLIAVPSRTARDWLRSPCQVVGNHFTQFCHSAASSTGREI